MVKAIVGAGGKTTLIKKLAEQYQKEGLRVFVTTSTHMFIEEDALLTDHAPTIIEQLEQNGYAMAGLPEGEKITALSPATYNAVCTHADVVLVEADGSRHMPIKLPGPNEPVIPVNTNEIIVVCGMHALGRPIAQAAHRPDPVCTHLGVSPNTIVTPDHILTLVLDGYVHPLQAAHPDKQVTVYPTHDDSPQQTDAAAWILSVLEDL